VTDYETERLKCIVAYVGTPFRGWQSQEGGNTVQDLLVDAFCNVTGRRLTVHGAGRTDAGVHAEAQCMHVDAQGGRIPVVKWPLALNAYLPPEIRVLSCERVTSDFHARFSATGKLYTYRIWNDRVHSPFELRRSWHIPRPLDLAAMRDAARLLIGTHNFAAFAANRGEPAQDTVRTIRAIDIAGERPLITMTFEANGFLYKMVRLLTGTIVRIGQGRDHALWIRRLLQSARGERSPYCAPAEGLYLTRVFY
jgi:tRNA pseudouridine38-40 synthase